MCLLSTRHERFSRLMYDCMLAVWQGMSHVGSAGSFSNFKNLLCVSQYEPYGLAGSFSAE